MKEKSKRFFSLFVLFFVLFVSGIFVVVTARAEDPISWATLVPKVLSSEDVSANFGWRDYCQVKFKEIPQVVPLSRGDPTEPTSKTDCLLGRQGGVNLLSYNYQNSIAVQFPGDTSAYPVAIGCLSCIYLPSRDLYITIQSNNDVRSGKVMIYKDFIKNLRFVDSFLKEDRYYAVNATPVELVSNFYGNSGYVGYIKHMQRSSNEKWLVVEFAGTGLFRINLETMEMLKFSDWPTQYWYAGPMMELDITNDGQHVAAFGLNTLNSIFDITTGCGRAMSANLTENELAQPQPVPCKALELSAPLGNSGNNTYMPRLRDTYQPKFSDDGGEISFYVTSYDPISPKMITLSAANYIGPPPLDYLALGDSYSSGEGDTEINPQNNLKWYRQWTDNEEDRVHNVPREKCHTGTRSYPYKLASVMGLDKEKWDTVACGGATTWDIKEQGSSDYKGQGKGPEKVWSDGTIPRLEGYDVATLKNKALNEFIPGRQKQIEFLKRYKPKAITLTIGGNDVDFGGKLAICFLPAQTCGAATEQGRKSLGIELQDQFKKLVSLYQELKKASPNTKVYVLGYVQIINGNANANCFGDSTGGLNAEERRMMQESYTYINNIIAAAAKYTGIKYIDIENALTNHKLCDDNAERYATGFASLGSSERQESFHPNAKGHQVISDTILNQLKENSTNYTLLDYPYLQQADKNVTAPIPPAYLASDTNHKKVVQTKELVNGGLKKSVPVPFGVDRYELKPNSTYKLTLHSDPIELGEYTTNEDGSSAVSVTTPSTVPNGYHTLILDGQTYSGEPVQYEQVIFVYGSNLNDLDEDNINDDMDKCLFVEPINMDRDTDGIDDACDIEVSEPKESYRVRSGDVLRQYAGFPEQTSYLYIERNIYATGTGISGDYDSDHDGWVIVAASKDATQAGPHARFWIDGADGRKIPHISFRTKENGCVQYKPTDLSKITEANSNYKRLFTQEGLDTATCRSDAPSVDMDNDGQPDNTQALYRVRNGDVAKGEDSKRLYLERSSRAAEAQLGKSDYASNVLTTPESNSGASTIDYRQPWSVLATSPVSFLPLNYKKVNFVSGYPYILATDFLGFCYAYKPQSLGTIKQSTQAIRQLQLDWSQTLIYQIQGACNG